VVGAGAGKSSLMKVIAGLDDEYDGKAHVHEGVKVGYLPQVRAAAACFRTYLTERAESANNPHAFPHCRSPNSIPLKTSAATFCLA
jgi:ATPase subunit of ABC transporter with duplicated ATPase domains